MTHAQTAPMIELQIADARWLEQLSDPKLLSEQCYAALFALLQIDQFRSGSLSVLLTDNLQMQSLNKQFADKDKPTNVLSFTSAEFEGPASSSVPLGDIAMGYEICCSEAKHQHKTMENHFCHLFIHGVLHLIGYDHQTTKTANAMEQLETNVMNKLGRPDPWAMEARS